MDLLCISVLWLLCLCARLFNEACIGGGGGGTKDPISLDVNRQISLIKRQISP